MCTLDINDLINSEKLKNESIEFYTLKEFKKKINYPKSIDVKFLVDKIRKKLNEESGNYRIQKNGEIIIIYNSLEIEKDEINDKLFQYQYKKFLNNKLMVLYFQIKDYRYYMEEKDEDYTLGFMFGKMWNLDFLENFNVEDEPIEKTKPLKLKGKKRNGLSRHFGYPNFVNFIQLRNLLKNEINEYIEDLTINKISSSKFLMNSYSDNQKIENEDFRMKNKDNILYLDIQNFYGSIYSHALDWSIRGIEEAKNNRNLKYNEKNFSEKLDYQVQYMNNGETFGLLVGTDISRIIAEIFIIMIENKEFEKNNFDLPIKRYVDDYKIFYNKEEEKEIIKDIENIFEKYRLLINDKKILKINKLEYLKMNYKGSDFKKIKNQIDNNLKNEYINGIASLIYNEIYLYLNNENKSMYKLYKEIEDIFKYIEEYDSENKTRYIDQIKKTKFIDLIIEIFIQNKGLDKYFLEFIYNNYEEIDDSWTTLFNQELLRIRGENDIYEIQILSLMFVYKLKINQENIYYFIESGNSISTTIVYSQLNSTNNTEYEKKIEDRILESIKSGAFKGEDFIFLTEFYLRNPKYKNKIKNCKICLSNIPNDSSINKYYKSFITSTDLYLIDYKKIK